MKKLLKYLTPNTETPQAEPMAGKSQVRNNAGGYVFAISPFDQLRRFLILGSESGTYYASERTLTIENAQNVLACLSEDGSRTVEMIVEVSDGGLAPKNTPAIFALAMAASVEDVETRQAALMALPTVCRTATHLFQFVEAVQSMRGWGRALRRSIGAWYTEKSARNLAYQLVKYRQRDGWTHADTLRLAHPKPADAVYDTLFKWVTDRGAVEWNPLQPPDDAALAYLWAFERAQATTDINTIVQLIQDYDLPREALPTAVLKSAEVWAALLHKMPMTAMLRNLGNMSKVGLLTEFSEAESMVTERLTTPDLIRKARIHPIAVLSGQTVYKVGYSLRGGYRLARSMVTESAQWKPTSRVLDALETAFELAFHNVQPANKRFLLGLDVSGSMSTNILDGVPGLTAASGSAAMSLITMRTEPQYAVMAFQHEFTPLNIHARMSMRDVIQATRNLPFGGTDCALPMIYAKENKLPVDQFVIYTDNEAWAGNMHPVEALQAYRDGMGIDARLTVVGMTATRFSIADPADAGMLDVVGFDASAPKVISDFARGDI